MTTIHSLPDEILLEIFDFCVVVNQDFPNSDAQPPIVTSGRDMQRQSKSWHLLVHVCRRWRAIVFKSAHRLNLQLVCTPVTPAKVTLDIWPPLPLLIYGDVSIFGADNIIVALKHSDRVCSIDLNVGSLQLENVLTAMQVPFPELTDLSLTLKDATASVIPDSFMGGSAPRLRLLCLDAIPFPALPNLLRSTTHLVDLRLLNIPQSGYISPEAMATCLSELTGLREISLEFQSHLPYPEQNSWQRLPSPRSVLPALYYFRFKGVNEYLEELVAGIDAPRLYQLSTTFFSQINFDIGELIQFISRTSIMKELNDARVVFDSRTAWVTFQPQISQLSIEQVKVEISCQVPDWQLSSLAQICDFSLDWMESLYVYENLHSQLDWDDNIENAEWLELLHSFTAVKNLYLSKQFAPRLAPALQELTGDRTTEVLPTLRNIFLEGFLPSKPVQEGIRQFVSARQLIDRPVAIAVWERGSELEIMSLGFREGKVVGGW